MRAVRARTGCELLERARFQKTRRTDLRLRRWERREEAKGGRAVCAVGVGGTDIIVATAPGVPHGPHPRTPLSVPTPIASRLARAQYRGGQTTGDGRGAEHGGGRSGFSCGVDRRVFSLGGLVIFL